MPFLRGTMRKGTQTPFHPSKRGYGQTIGVDTGMVDNPELANKEGTAAKLRARFVKDRELAIKEVLISGDL
jgi:hypothetical protein